MITVLYVLLAVIVFVSNCSLAFSLIHYGARSKRPAVAGAAAGLFIVAVLAGTIGGGALFFAGFAP